LLHLEVAPAVRVLAEGAFDLLSYFHGGLVNPRGPSAGWLVEVRDNSFVDVLVRCSLPRLGLSGDTMPKKGYRSYIDVETIPDVNSSLVSTGSCASLVQHYTRVGPTANWKEGEVVKGNSIKKGTAIATFVNGVYPNKKHDNHAALYVSQDATGIWVVDQWEGLPKPHKRKLSFKGKTADGSGWEDPSNNGDALSVIEL
jgi:hypothetical protein